MTIDGSAVGGGGGAVVYATADLLPLSGNSAGDMAYVTATNRFYINNGSGWYSVSLVNTNPNITSAQDASSNTTPFTLTTDGTATVITITASDPEEVPITYAYSVTSGSLTNGGGTTATVSQGTGANVNKFTVTPSTTAAYAGTFTLTFTASDGINQATSANSFTLNFITTITDSKYTTMLAQAVGANNGTNSSLTDSSSNTATITNTGTPVAGTFSPYRSGGYSTNFVTSSYLTSGMTALSTSNYTIECWVNFRALTGSPWILEGRYDASNNSYGNGGLGIRLESSGKLRAYHSSSYIDGTTVLSLDTWHHVMVVRSGTGTNEFKVYLDGNLEVQGTDANSKTCTHFKVGAAYTGGNNPKAHIRDLRISNTARATTSPTEPVEADSNTLWLGCNKQYIVDVSASSNSVTVTGDVATKPIGPYDSEEYAAADHGGSIYFDGSSGASFSQINLSSTYTVECWFYATSTDQWQTLFWTASPFNQFLVRWTSSGVELQYYTKITHQTKTALNTWNHAALVSDGTDVYLYLNGERSTNSVSATTNSFSVNYLGWRNGEEFTGNIADTRIIDGTAVYSGASFTPPAAPLSSSGTDIHLKGTDASIIDKSGSTLLTLGGDAKCTTTPVRSGQFANSKSMYFPGSTDYITTQNLPALGTSDFTAEAWVYETSQGSWGVVIDWREESNTDGSVLRINNGVLKWEYLGSSRITAGTTFSTNTWYHVAVSRSGSSTKLFINGSQTGSTYSDTHNYPTYEDRPIMGTNGYAPTSGYDFTGYLQDVRVTVGKARYTSNFSVPTAPLEG